jgi:hypothetical protein
MMTEQAQVAYAIAVDGMAEMYTVLNQSCFDFIIYFS